MADGSQNHPIVVDSDEEDGQAVNPPPAVPGIPAAVMPPPAAVAPPAAVQAAAIAPRGRRAPGGARVGFLPPGAGADYLPPLVSAIQAAAMARRGRRAPGGAMAPPAAAMAPPVAAMAPPAAAMAPPAVPAAAMAPPANAETAEFNRRLRRVLPRSVRHVEAFLPEDLTDDMMVHFNSNQRYVQLIAFKRFFNDDRVTLSRNNHDNMLVQLRAALGRWRRNHQNRRNP